MTSPAPASRLDRWERACLRLCVSTLEKRAKQGPRVEISDRLAVTIARYLRRLLPPAKP